MTEDQPIYPRHIYEWMARNLRAHLIEHKGQCHFEFRNNDADLCRAALLAIDWQRLSLVETGDPTTPPSTS